jgi:hypothetical protein
LHSFGGIDYKVSKVLAMLFFLSDLQGQEVNETGPRPGLGMGGPRRVFSLT